MNRTDYQAQFTKDHYDRLSLYLPKGMKEKVRSAADQCHASVNDYITRLIDRDIDEQGHSHLATLSRFGEPEKRILQKWQVAAKYYDMIESISEQDGYYVLLKQGFTNDVTGSRTIHAENLKDIRIMITKSHPVRTGQLVEGVDEVTAEWLRKWQTPRKYYHMIESASFTREDGFTIVLKEGFTNDATGSRLIHSDSLKVFKPLIKHSHSV